MVAALGAVNPGAVLGEGVILKRGSVVEHGRLGAFIPLSPNAALAGEVISGDRAHLRLGAVELLGVRFGAEVRIGAGAGGIWDVPDGLTVLGVPAKEGAVGRPKGAAAGELRREARPNLVPRNRSPSDARLLPTATIARSTWPSWASHFMSHRGNV